MRTALAALASLAASVALVVLAAFAPALVPAPARGAPATGEHGMVATADRHATLAALQVLREGGRATDAAITAAVVLAVTEPYSSGLGGGGFVLGYQARGAATWALDCRETAPAAATRDMFRGADGQVDPALSRTGGRSVAVPGLVRGLWDLHGRHGTRPWARLIAPAEALARDGFVVGPRLAARIAAHAARLSPDARAVLLPGGMVPVPGDTLRQPDLARTLAAIAAHGPDAFYGGAVAAAIVGAVQQDGGVLTADDLAAYRTVWREPLAGTYRGLQVVSMPPPSTGGVALLQMLDLLEPQDLAAAGHGSAAAWHPLLEAMKLAYADRSRYLGDPAFVPVPVDRLLGRARLDSLRRRIRADRALDPADIPGAPLAAEPEHTTHLSVVDAQGNAVAATLTINLSFGSGLIAPGTGVILNDEMDDFAAAPGVPNAFGLVQGENAAVGPGRRPPSSMTPTVVLGPDGVRLVTGSPGGARIITATLQTIVNVVDFGMDARAAAAAPRVHHQWSPAHGWYEQHGLAPEVRRALSELGHELQPRGAMGNVQLIVRDVAAGRWTGASDPRGVGLAAGFTRPHLAPPAPAAAGPGTVDPGAVDPGAVDPAAVDPAAVDPAAVIRALTAPELAGRGAGTPGERAAARWFADRLADLGLAPAAGGAEPWLQPFALPDSLGGGTSQNVLGRLPGAGALAGRWVVLGAHLDHLGRVETDAPADRPAAPGAYYPGAGDNASGVAALLRAVAALAMVADPAGGPEPAPGPDRASGPSPGDRRGLLVCGFGAEEQGLLGSRHLVADLPVPAHRIDAMINLDAVGRLGAGPLYAAGQRTCADLDRLLTAAAGELRVHRQDPRLLQSDHVPFLDRGIPAVLLFTGAYPEMNSPADSLSAVDLAGVRQVAAVTAALVAAMRALPRPCEFVAPLPATAPAAGGNRATWFGSAPDFGGRQAEGYLLGGVAEDGPAARAGLRAGDLVVELAGEPVGDLAGFTLALRRYDPGDVVEVVVRRDGRARRFHVTLGDRADRGR